MSFKERLKDMAIGILSFVICMCFLCAYVGGICIPFSNDSDLRFGFLFVGGFVIIDIIIRLEERFDFLNKIKSKSKIIPILLVIIGIIFIYNSCFRYKYTVYKGKQSYTAEVIKVDRLTGKTEMTVIKPRNLKNN